MPTIPKHWLDSEDAGIDPIALPGGDMLYDPATGCVSGDGGICWEQPDLLSLLRDAARLDWLAMYGTFGVDSVSGIPGGNGQRRIAAVRSCIDKAMMPPNAELRGRAL